VVEVYVRREEEEVVEEDWNSGKEKIVSDLSRTAQG
jgi:hypothetical protein